MAFTTTSGRIRTISYELIDGNNLVGFPFVPGTVTGSDNIAALTHGGASDSNADGNLSITHILNNFSGASGSVNVDSSSHFKFIVGHEDPIKDFSEISHLVQYLGIPNNKVFISPMGTTPERIMKVTNRIADLVTYHRWNLTTRLHIIAWGDERGR